MTEMHCPTCGHALPTTHVPVGALTSIRLGSTERGIIEGLVKAYPRPMTTERLADHIYRDDPNGGASIPHNVIGVVMGRLRLKLAKVGWTIPKARPGPGGEGYRLQPIQEA